MKNIVLLMLSLLLFNCGKEEKLSTSEANALTFLNENKAFIEGATLSPANVFRNLKSSKSLEYGKVNMEYFFDINDNYNFNLISLVTDCGINEIPDSDERNFFSQQSIDYSIGFRDIKNLSSREYTVDKRIYYVLSLYYEKEGVKRTETDFSLLMCNENIDFNFPDLTRNDRATNDTLFVVFDNETRLNDFKFNIDALID
ncbi:hypothetical protein QYS49_34840 [Marivirga salinae]|uniref:Uncharacterized protein n=1 Tax=Marivirga salinarum TaxID=3059078 RepID=A0AA51NCI1_9BACT|nr:hypothetical protein [Marivirga sp. BDSF4-3]WMN12862.1 hypothetical protein QYS49_34840 [Marivirga sp. BDSF4-3]